MFRIKLHLSKEAPCNVVKDMELIFTSLKMPYNKKNDVYTITDENEVSVLYKLSQMIDEKNYLKYIVLWENYDSDPAEYDKEDYKYTFSDTNELFAKEDVLKLKNTKA